MRGLRIQKVHPAPSTHHRGLLGDRHIRSGPAVVTVPEWCEDKGSMGSASSTRPKASPTRIGSREDAIRWARTLLSGEEFVVLDSETTGLGNPIDFVEVGVVSSQGEPLFDSLIEPSCPVDPRASRVHGHTTESLAGERRFFDVYPDLLDVLWAKRGGGSHAPHPPGRGPGPPPSAAGGEGRFFGVYPDLLDVLWAKRVVVYNASYDRRVWDAAVGRLGARAALAGELASWECAMRAFAAYARQRETRRASAR